jgi:inosine/xanthosine triphosphatase
MKIAVGSINPVKISATENIFSKIYGKVEVVGLEVDSGVSEQPIGIDETIKGAINRAKKVYNDDFDFSVGVESGLMKTPHSISGYIDLQWCAIFDGHKVTLGVSSGFEYPPCVIENVLKGKEVGDVMDKVTGINDLGEKMGAVSYLSRGMLDRTQNTEQCILMAMIPRLNEDIYFK